MRIPSIRDSFAQDKHHSSYSTSFYNNCTTLLKTFQGHKIGSDEPSIDHSRDPSTRLRTGLNGARVYVWVFKSPWKHGKWSTARRFYCLEHAPRGGETVLSQSSTFETIDRESWCASSRVVNTSLWYSFAILLACDSPAHPELPTSSDQVARSLKSGCLLWSPILSRSFLDTIGNHSGHI